MTRTEAVDIRARQLAGERFPDEVVAQAVEVIRVGQVKVKRKPGRQPGFKAEITRMRDFPGLLAARERRNRILAGKLHALGAV